MSSSLHIDFKFALRFLGTAILITQLSCSNALSTFANKTTDEALYYKASNYIDDANYAAAITACAEISVSYLLNTNVATVCASAYAGRCGFTMSLTATRVATAIGATTAVAEWYLQNLGPFVAQNISDCKSAMLIIHNVGTAASRDNDLNAFAALLAVHTLGVAGDALGDATVDNALDGGFDSCALSNANADSIGLAFWELKASAAALATTPPFDDIDTAMTAACGVLNGLGQDLCAAADPLALSANERKGAKSILKEGSFFGVDQCGGGTSLATCNCP